MNYFELFDFPVSYDIDELLLTREYFKKQLVVHPDINNGVQIEIDAAYVNTAYKTLLDPVKRAEYFLLMNNITVDAICSHHADEMFSIRENFSMICDDNEKVKFCRELERRVVYLIAELKKEAHDLNLFHETFVFLKFINSFLEKVRLYVYNRD